ncbi:aspartate-semialdehyde dehydrogenase [Planococcus sp. N028]|uniref:Aspartate-semialdehyde dehydrogenase n=1 Tax=Planococcus shixiaomingii TaxID=3058393 RepID=A0ABT8N030_9BACL|nr:MULTISPECIES: aspartate-semialdehyde dehydrogenase [unclassified Planococcus (in: firmicutes)]MDN7241233.1 aspartate-semialdehyde dehydrogenase [Planococcus sp. N028]WKA53493.1 aspartate-semialdehyde dehydrogenase [Planococcus sp. N022]
MKSYNVAIMGATGAVGQQMKEQLEKRNFPVRNIVFLASSRSAGQEITFKGETYTVQEAVPESFEGIDIALFSAGGSISEKFAPEAVKRGAVVIDNTSAFRMDKEVPLVVPEVNKADLRLHKGIIANPNCSTIQMVCALQPLKEQYGLSKVIVSTYQAVSGAGVNAINELKKQSADFDNAKHAEASVLPVKSADRHYPIAFNAIPQIDQFTDNGYTYEEMKMINETKKIMHDETLSVAATCVRLPVVTGHSESLYVELDGAPTVEEVRQAIANAPGVELMDDPSNQVYPMPLMAAGLDEVFVGRIRADLDNPRGFHLWVVSDNLVKGAALNSVQIAEALVGEQII